VVFKDQFSRIAIGDFDGVCFDGVDVLGESGVGG
jgi:hypothetical protein